MVNDTLIPLEKMGAEDELRNIAAVFEEGGNDNNPFYFINHTGPDAMEVARKLANALRDRIPEELAEIRQSSTRVVVRPKDLILLI